MKEFSFSQLGMLRKEARRHSFAREERLQDTHLSTPKVKLQSTLFHCTSQSLPMMFFLCSLSSFFQWTKRLFVRDAVSGNVMVFVGVVLVSLQVIAFDQGFDTLLQVHWLIKKQKQSLQDETLTNMSRTNKSRRH